MNRDIGAIIIITLIAFAVGAVSSYRLHLIFHMIMNRTQ